MFPRFDPTSCLRHVSLAAWVCAVVIAAGSAAAQSGEPKPEGGDFFTQIGRWFDGLGDQFKSAGKGVDDFGKEAGMAAKQTAEAAGDAAGAVARLPETRVVRGHQDCEIAGNGAPDCRSAANALCRAHGLKSGRSLDITAAENCPVRVIIGEREAQDGECRNVTFVSRALCQ